MTVIAEFGHGSLTLGANEYICQIQSARVVAANNRRDIITACGTSSRFVNQRYDLIITFLQDWSGSGISKYLWDHFNQDVAFSFAPDPDGTPLMAGNVTCPEPDFGGDALDVLTAQCTLPLTARPTLTADV